MRRVTILPLLLAAVFGGCSVKHGDVVLSPDDTPVLNAPVPEVESTIRALYTAVKSLSAAVSDEDARTLSRAAVLYPRYLAGRYGLVRPPYLHNFLITLGIKERGLCYHWAGDLMAYLKRQGFASLDLHRGVAEQGSLREHHCVVVTAKGQPFSEGILLDAWRGSSELYFKGVGEDGAYDWQENPRYAAVKQR